MRPALTTLLLAALLTLPAAVRAGVVSVDPVLRRVETPHLVVRFDLDCPEILRQVVFKSWSPTTDLSADESSQFEFWGQTARSVSGPGHIRPLDLLVADWVVLSQSDSQVVIGIQSVTDFEPTVTTLYTFHAAHPWFDVERTVSFAEFPESTAYQAYVPRVAISTSSRALRYRNASGHIEQRAYCFNGCETSDWNRRWLMHCGWTGTQELMVASVFADDDEQGPSFVRGRGPLSGSDWLAPLRPARMRDSDDRARVRVVFGLDTENYAWLDSLYTAINEAGTPVSASPPLRADALARVLPNPSRSTARLELTLPRAAPTRVTVVDAAGRAIRGLHAGVLGSGTHVLAWDGRDLQGRTRPPGLYFMRIELDGRPWRSVRFTRLN